MSAPLLKARRAAGRRAGRAHLAALSAGNPRKTTAWMVNPGLKKPDEVDCGRACERRKRASERFAHRVTAKPDRARTHPADGQRERDPDSVREPNLQDACEARARSAKEIPASKRVRAHALPSPLTCRMLPSTNPAVDPAPMNV